MLLDSPRDRTSASPALSEGLRYVLVTAAHNEEQLIEQTIRSVIGQTMLPVRWVIVSDASTDRTDEIVAGYARQHDFLRLHRITEKHARNFGAQVMAIRAGYEDMQDVEFDFIGNLDADVAMDSGYFETLLNRFRGEPRLGLAGGDICEMSHGEFRSRPANNPRSVAHAVQMFRRSCFEAVGGYWPMKYGGPDWVAEVRARQMGWAVRSYPDLPVRHYRPTNAADGRLRGCWRQGRMDYSVGSLFAFELFKCARRIPSRPFFFGAATRLLAYCISHAAGEPRLVPEDFVRYLQDEQHNRLSAVTRLGHPETAAGAVRKGKTIWIDLDNSPHVPFFAPIIEELRKRGYSVRLTARDAFQVKELVALYQFDCQCIGRHYGKHTLLKLLGVLIRSLQLLPSVLRIRPDLAVAHGSRAQLALATAMGIPTLHIGDYEHATGWAIIHPSWVLVPEVIPAEGIREPQDRILRYPGIKEDVYVPAFRPDPAIRGQLNLSDDDLVITVRPPADEAHYRNPLSDELFHATLEFLSRNPRVKIVVLPRNQRQAKSIESTWPELFAKGRMLIPPQVVDGLNLIWYSDAVISGGGTMNREAAALGVPVYSIFRGKTGAVDRYLSESGRLVMIETAEDLAAKVRLVHRNRPAAADSAQRPALQAIVDHIIAILENQCGTRALKTTA